MHVVSSLLIGQVLRDELTFNGHEDIEAGSKIGDILKKATGLN